jgi:hypothetical protein
MGADTMKTSISHRIVLFAAAGDLLDVGGDRQRAYGERCESRETPLADGRLHRSRRRRSLRDRILGQ